MRPAMTDGGADKPVDLVHLAAQTAGDTRLERELLQMFARQAMLVAAALPCADADYRREHAHRLKGGARSLGAVRLAGLAGRIELEPDGDLGELLAEIARVVRFVAELDGPPTAAAAAG